MGTTANGGKRSKGRAANGDQPIGAASCRRDHHTMASCQNPNTHHETRPQDHHTNKELPTPTEQPTPPATTHTRMRNAGERGHNTRSKGIKDRRGGSWDSVGTTFLGSSSWDKVDRFVTSENYTPLPLSSSDAVKANLSSTLQAHNWPLNKETSIPLRYVLAKANSVTKQMTVGRPIAAVVQPFILRHWLRLAARVFTLFLKPLVFELPACFLHVRI